MPPPPRSAHPLPLAGRGRGGGREATRQRRRISFASQLPSPVPGEDAERCQRSAGEGPRRRRALPDRDDKPPRYSGSGGEAGDLGFDLCAPARGFLPIGQALVEIRPHRLAVERDHHRCGWVGWAPRRLRPKRVGKTCPRLRPGIVRARCPRGGPRVDDFAHPTHCALSTARFVHLCVRRARTIANESHPDSVVVSRGSAAFGELAKKSAG